MICLFKPMITETGGKIGPSNAELLARAVHAFCVTARRNGLLLDQPSNTSDVQEITGKRYVILQNVKGVLAVYRVRNDGMLKRLKRWPEGLLRSLPEGENGKPRAKGR